MPAIVLINFLLACGDVSQSHDLAAAAAHQQSLEIDLSAHDYIFACQEDSDCVAVPKAGLCRNGIKEAVNRHHLQAYQEAFSKTRRGACTFLLIRDRRVARCDAASKRCSLVVKHEQPRLPAVFSPPGPAQ